MSQNDVASGLSYYIPLRYSDFFNAEMLYYDSTDFCFSCENCPISGLGMRSRVSLVEIW